LGLRKLLAACLRPQRSLIYGASDILIHNLGETYLPHNIRVCHDEKEVAEDFGPFLLEKDKDKEFELEENSGKTNGREVERRRSKRMHVAIPIALQFQLKSGEVITTNAISTNISEGGLFAEYLDLETAQRIETIEPITDLMVDIHILPNANFSDEYHIRGRVMRKELRKKQLGLAVEFVAEA